MVTFYKATSEEESANDKNFPHNISTLTSDNAVTMEGIEQMSQKMLQEKSKIKWQKQQ